MIPYILLLLALLSYFLYFNNKIEKFTSKKVKKIPPLQKKRCNLKNTNNFKKPLPKPFIASNTFQGAKAGYIFKKDHQGIGYYLDNK